MNLKIFLIYINALVLTFSITSFSVLLGVDQAFFSRLSVFTFTLFFCVSIREFIKSSFFWILLCYLFSLLLSFTMVKEIHLSMIAGFFCPFLMCITINDSDIRYLKPLFYFFIAIFVINAISAFLEKYMGFWIVPVALNNDVLQGQMVSDVRDLNNFRAFAFFGHPLTNGNVMSLMSFVIFYTKSLPERLRIILFLLGMSSLFCFNTRGAILVSFMLFIPALFSYIKNKSSKTPIILTIIIIAYLLISNFDSFGGRLANSDLNDSNTDVRLMAINEFLSYSFSDLLSGGLVMKNGENGYLMILAYYGLIVGTIKIVVEIYLSYKLIRNEQSKIHKLIMMLSLIAVGSTNNNLATVMVVPFYILFITFVINNQNSLNPFNKKLQKKLLH